MRYKMMSAKSPIYLILNRMKDKYWVFDYSWENKTKIKNNKIAVGPSFFNCKRLKVW